MDYYFITGSSRGIGRALVEKALERPNARVMGFARSAGWPHPRYAHTTVDVSALAGRADTFFPAVDAPRRLVLINNAGTLGEVKYLGELDDLSVVTLFNLNVTAPTLLMNAFIRRYRAMRAEKLIINVSSGAGKYPVDGWSGYCASKAALDMVSQVAAQESALRNDGFRVFALAPGVVDTAMQDHIRTTDAASFSKRQKFVDYKAENALDDPAATAEKFFRLIDHPERFPEVMQDVRDFF